MNHTASSRSIQIGARTDPGRVRDHNEDALSLPPPRLSRRDARQKGYLWLVADGMGGHRAGHIASQLAAETTQVTYYAQNGGQPQQALAQAMQAANQAVYAQAQTPACQGMGTTLVAALAYDQHLIIGHVGDSRAYLLHHGRLQRLTEDNTWVAEQVKAGILTPHEAAHHEQKGVLTRALGRQPTTQATLQTYAWQPGDTFLLCSDGLTNCLTDAEIADILATAPPPAAADRLIVLSNQRGGPDNITVIVGRQPAASRLRFLDNLLDRPAQWPGLALMALGVGLLVVLVLFITYRFFLTNDLPNEPPQPELTARPVSGLLFSARLEQAQRAGDQWQLTVRNTGGQYLVFCRSHGGATLSDTAPMVYNLVVVYGRRQPGRPAEEIEADFIDAEAFPYNSTAWYLWCDQSPPLQQEVWVQTSLAHDTAHYIRLDQALNVSLPQSPSPSPVLIYGRWVKTSQKYFLVTRAESILNEIGQPFIWPQVQP